MKTSSVFHKTVAAAVVDTIVKLYGRIIYFGFLGGGDLDIVVRDIDPCFIEIIDHPAVFIFSYFEIVGSNIKYDLPLTEVCDQKMLRFGMSAQLSQTE